MNSYNAIKIGQVVQSRREALHLTQAQLASSIHYTERTIGSIERAERDTVNDDTLSSLASVLYPDNPDDFFKEIQSFSLAEHSAAIRADPIITDENLKRIALEVLDPQRSDAVSYALASLSAYMMYAEQNKYNLYFLDCFASSMQSYKLSSYITELEPITRYLLLNLSSLASSYDALSSDANEIIQQLKSARLAKDNEAWLTAIRSAFYLIYDAWDTLQHDSTAYAAIQNISILLCGADDSDYARHNVAKAISIYSSMSLM